MTTKKCSHCLFDIPEQADICGHCGRAQPPSNTWYTIKSDRARIEQEKAFNKLSLSEQLEYLEKCSDELKAKEAENEQRLKQIDLQHQGFYFFLWIFLLVPIIWFLDVLISIFSAIL